MLEKVLRKQTAKKTSEKQFRIEKVMNCKLNGKAMIVNLIVELIKKT